MMLTNQVGTTRSRLRRKGYRLLKNRARNLDRPDYGLFLIVDAETGFVVAGGKPWNYSLFLEEATALAAELPDIKS